MNIQGGTVLTQTYDKITIENIIDIDNLTISLGDNPRFGLDKAIFVLNENTAIPKPNYYKQFKEIIFETKIPFSQNVANAIILASIVLKKENISIACHIETELELKKAIMISNQFGIPLIVKLEDKELFTGFIEYLCRANHIKIPVYPFAYMVKDYTMSQKRIPIHMSTYNFSHLYSYLKTDYRMVLSGYPIIGQYLKTLYSVLKKTTPDAIKNMIPTDNDVPIFVMHNKNYDSEKQSIINAIDIDIAKHPDNTQKKTGGYNFLTCTYQYYIEYKELVSKVAEKYPAQIILHGNNILRKSDLPSGYSAIFLRNDLCKKYPGLYSMKNVVTEYIVSCQHG